MNDPELFKQNDVSHGLKTTKEIAELLGTSPKVILENARKCLPDKVIENGKPTYWSKAEVTVLLEQMKCNQPNGYTFPNLLVELKGVKRCERDSSITTLQFAKQLGTSSDVILSNAKKCLPNKIVENGKPTFWTKEEITVILDYMNSHTSNNRSVEFNSTVKNTSTDLTPALKIKKAFDLAVEGYEEELAILKAKSEEQQKVIDRIANGSGCFTINQTAKALKLPYGNITLFEKLRGMGILNTDNTPKQEHVNAGRFKVVVKFVNEKVGNKPVTIVTGKGLVYLAKKFNTEIDQSVKADA